MNQRTTSSQVNAGRPQDIPEPALQQHVFWGSLLAGLLMWGPGRWSVDRFLAPAMRRRIVGWSKEANPRSHVAASSPR